AAARSALETASALERYSATREAVVCGELSLDQARLIAETEAAVPGSEAELVALARRSSLAALGDEARRRRLEALEGEELYRRQCRARALRHWRNAEGMVCLRAELAPDRGIGVVNRLEAETDRLIRRARREGEAEPRAAHAADALLNLLDGSARAKAKGTEMVIVCDLAAYRRGEARPGELSHIVGGGPLAVSVVRELAHDAFLKAVLADGTQIHTVAHFGRHIPAELRTALELGPLPALDGVACAEEGCDRRYGLEWDHVDPVANGGPTSYANLKPRCWPHHQAKTERDRAAGLLGVGGGARSSVPP
ncbi:MAG: HNH endonuclease, partial [Actinomycetota bacterium]|nr:HNH endonuclease [Actinomycetota bacterium]